MKIWIVTLLLVSFSIVAQKPVDAIFIKETPLKAKTFIGVDNFNAMYVIDKDVLYKKDNAKTISYNNLQLGSITSANVSNPLKINVFYRDFNTVVILDNRLAEIIKLDFNSLEPYKSISCVSPGHDSTLWIFNQITQQLEIYDYNIQKTRAKTMPVSSSVLDIKSNYNTCWLLTDNYLYQFNYFGTLVKKTKNDGYTAIAEDNENIILKKNHSLYYLKKNTNTIVPIHLPNLLIKQFSVTNETLYIYNNETLKEFQLKTN